MGERSDEELMLRCRSGDRSAFALLVDRYQRKVVVTILRFGHSQADAEDLAQDVFLKIFRAAPDYRPEARFSTWLYRIVTNACLNFREKRRPMLTEELDALTSPLPSPAETFDRSEIQAAIARAVESLPDPQRLAVILTRFDGFSYRETAEIMETTLPAVESLLQRAYQSLRERLSAGFPSLRG